ncbi:hypothetical protein B0H13DRAFT_193760 [Mycena leptocephala]|nr:hypothetical protein B0H13DRAFT_193760 [Mycena leptocephala]
MRKCFIVRAENMGEGRRGRRETTRTRTTWRSRRLLRVAASPPFASAGHGHDRELGSPLKFLLVSLFSRGTTGHGELAPSAVFPASLLFATPSLSWPPSSSADSAHTTSQAHPSPSSAHDSPHQDDPRRFFVHHARRDRCRSAARAEGGDAGVGVGAGWGWEVFEWGVSRVFIRCFFSSPLFGGRAPMRSTYWCSHSLACSDPPLRFYGI